MTLDQSEKRAIWCCVEGYGRRDYRKKGGREVDSHIHIPCILQARGTHKESIHHCRPSGGHAVNNNILKAPRLACKLSRAGAAYNTILYRVHWTRSDCILSHPTELYVTGTYASVTGAACIQYCIMSEIRLHPVTSQSDRLRDTHLHCFMSRSRAVRDTQLQ